MEHLKRQYQLYRTPRHIVVALLKREVFPVLIWEPCSGMGDIMDVLREWDSGRYLDYCFCSDIHDWGVEGTVVQDFLTSEEAAGSIVTKPPEELADRCIRHAKEQGDKIAMLLPISVEQNAGWDELRNDKDYPIRAVYGFTQPVKWLNHEEAGEGIQYAWFVLERGYKGPTIREWITFDAETLEETGEPKDAPPTGPANVLKPSESGKSATLRSDVSDPVREKAKPDATEMDFTGAVPETSSPAPPPGMPPALPEPLDLRVLQGKGRPLHSNIVRAYGELQEDLKAFADGKYNFMLLIGTQGLGKSEIARNAVPGVIVIDTRLSAFELYRLLYLHRNQPFLIDDVPGLWKDKHIVALLKSLTETKATKTVSWNTTAVGRHPDNIPASFQTTTRLIVIINSWDSRDENIKALEGRGVTFIFAPSPWEVHREVARGGWFKDQEVYDFIYEHLHFVKVPSFRLYLQASEQRQAGRPWKQRLLEWMVGEEGLLRLVRFLEDPRFTNLKETEKAKAFAQVYRTTERQFWRLKAKLPWLGQPGDLEENPKLQEDCGKDCNNVEKSK